MEQNEKDQSVSVRCQVLVWGGYFCDLIYTGLPGFPRLGAEIYSQGFEMRPGGCFTTVLALKRLHVQASWACDFGNDLFSSLVLEQASREDFDHSLFRYHDYPLRRITSVISFPHERAFLSFMDPVEAADPLPLMQQVQAEWLLLSHLYYGEECLPLFQAARRQGMRIFMDCQSIDTTLAETPQLAHAVSQVDVFSPNEVEALQLTGETQAEKALGSLADLAPLVVIKCGKDGALASWQGKTYHSAAYTAGDQVETTGAGDCFDAGYLYATLNGHDIETCLRIANICGGLSVRSPGGQGAPAEEEVLKCLSSHLLR